MAVAKRKPSSAPPPVQLQPSDPGRVWERMIRKLAEQAGTDPGHLVEEWSERAAILEYDGYASAEDANRRAYELVHERLFPQMEIAL